MSVKGTLSEKSDSASSFPELDRVKSIISLIALRELMKMEEIHSELSH